MRSRTANFELRKGEHVAIMGDNGAGKSTFVRQITGVEQRDPRARSGSTARRCDFAGPLDAREAGIETVFQTLALADDLDVPDNLFLGREKIQFNLGPFSILDYKGMREATIAGLKKTGGEDPEPRRTPSATCRAGSGSAWRSPAPRPSTRSSPSWTSRRRRSGCRRPRRSRTSSAR